MQAIYNLLYEPPLPLSLVGIVVGAWLIASHAFALIRPGIVQPFLRAFPRNEKVGIPLVLFCFAWGLMLWSCMDLGEFYTLERPVQIVIIGVAVGVIVYVREFIAVRALGFLLILVAAPILDAAFLQEPRSRLLLVALAYAGAVKGMFWVGMPYLLRDQINWLLARETRYRIGAAIGLAYGIVVLVCALVWW